MTRPRSALLPVSTQRLLYVAMRRARDRLYVLFERTGYGFAEEVTGPADDAAIPVQSEVQARLRRLWE